ncbi:MAG: alpha/beta hydrolase fold domain-containing protein, partial [Novosphingobium sp.]|nr:alpha/beta hydrolase fold domain-containing protein [Novosphingobium sp.]
IGEPGEGLKVETPTYALDDALAALRLVRANAKKWNIDPARVGMVGFSAGARLAIATVGAASPEDMPAFIAPIYPPMDKVTVPGNAPPMFVGMANDDPLSGKAGYALIQSWTDAKKPVEFHMFQSGSHGFGLGARANTTWGWIDLLVRWIRFNSEQSTRK